ncbi:MAG: DUF1501 domain-containing protein, partial [Planctomycetota bacterium]|nr:DUF1501 domain-containing protein [Planctomycetota bacterium]
MPSTRRELLAAGALGAAGITILGKTASLAEAAPEREIAMKPALVVLFLRGGQDALNTLVPYTDGKYYDMRPNIAVPAPGEERGAIDLDGTFGLNPALTGFKKLWDKKMLAPIVNCGCPHPSRSHFDQQDFFEYGAPGDKSVRTGWLNRYLWSTTGSAGPAGEFRSVAIQGRLPRSLRGKYPVLAVPQRVLRGAGAGGDEDVLELFDDLYAAPPSMTKPGAMGERPDEDELTQNGRTTIDTLRKLEEILKGKQTGKVVRYPASAGYLGRQLAMTARVLKSGQGVEVVGIDWNGWDHHINQGGSGEQDTIFRMLSQLGSAIETFFEDVDSMKKKVNLLIMTEFGRTSRENGNFGTDHGRGGHMYLIGGNVAGGKIYGDWNLPRDRELPVTTDFRRVYTEVLRNHMRLHPSKNLFKGWTQPADDIGLYKQA